MPITATGVQFWCDAQAGLYIFVDHELNDLFEASETEKNIVIICIMYVLSEKQYRRKHIFFIVRIKSIDNKLVL